MAMDQSKFLEHAKQIASSPENKWVLDLFCITKKMGLFPAPINGTPPELLLLNLPEKCEKPLLDYTKNNGLLIHVHEQGQMLYSGYFDHMIHGKPPKPEGVQWGAKSIKIYPAPEGANINEIYYTQEVH